MKTTVRNLFEVRNISPDKMPGDNAEFQAWFKDHQNYRWNQAKRLTQKLVDGKITPTEWHDALEALLMEGHSNAWQIGRTLGGADVSDFNDSDLYAGRGYKDVEADYLARFLDAIQNGAFTDEETGTIIASRIDNRARLYLGKMRGTANDAFVYGSPDEADFYWKLGAPEEHCEECPQLAELFNPSKKEHLFATPGSGDTPCLGNCYCHIERVVNDETTIGLKPVVLEMPDYE